MAEESHVTVMAWPKESLPVTHQFDSDEPCPVLIGFNEKTEANVIVRTSPREPLRVDMGMKVSAERPFPVCIQMCEPICAKSDYTVQIEIFDRPVIAIRVKGLTRLFNCREEAI